MAARKRLRIFLWIVFAFASIVVLLLAGMWAGGRRLPLEHTATVAARFAAPAETVFDALADMEGHPSWAPDVSAVERLPDRDGHEAWRQRMGGNSFVLTTTRFERPRVIVREIEDDNKMFSGSWELEVTPADGGCRVRITERGKIPNPIARFIMQKLADPSATARAYLEALAKKFGQSPRWE